MALSLPDWSTRLSGKTAPVLSCSVRIGQPFIEQARGGVLGQRDAGVDRAGRTLTFVEDAGEVATLTGRGRSRPTVVVVADSTVVVVTGTPVVVVAERRVDDVSTQRDDHDEGDEDGDRNRRHVSLTKVLGPNRVEELSQFGDEIRFVRRVGVIVVLVVIVVEVEFHDAALGRHQLVVHENRRAHAQAPARRRHSVARSR